MARAYTSYAQHVSLTPQSQPIPGREADMLPNNAGGYGFRLDDWERLHRFLVLGSDSGSYYVGEQQLTAQNAAAAIRCIKAEGWRAVEMARDVNMENRAPRVDPQLFVLALALKYGDSATKRAAETVLPDMLRIGTHVLHFAAMLDSLGGWSRVKRRIVAAWFERQNPDRLAFQVLKYQQRDGFAMRDLLRLSHPAAPTPEHAAVYNWICSRPNETALPAVLDGYLAMRQISEGPIAQALWGIAKGLPREALPTEALTDRTVWRALLPDTPPHALLRNLGNLTANGTLTGASNVEAAAAKIADRESLRRARVHPFAIMLAALVYQQGHGVRGGKSWTPNNAILAALEDAYDAAFDTVQPTGKRICVAIDISGSMSAPCVGTPIPAAMAASAMGITLARSEPAATLVQFDTAVQRIVPVTRRTGVLSVAATNGTDLAAPIRWALGERTEHAMSSLWGGGFGRVKAPTSQADAKREHFDAFVILTDNETWHGCGHASQFLERYRRDVNRNAKLVVCAMAANHANIVDPDDGLSLGACGLDAHLPSIVTEFIRS